MTGGPRAGLRGAASCPTARCASSAGTWMPGTSHAGSPDRKITKRKWARGSGPGPGAVIGPGQGRYGLRGAGDGDGDAERFDLPDVVFDLLVLVEAGLVIAVAEVGEPGCGILQQVPDDDQDGAGDGGLAKAAAQPGVALALLPGPGAGAGLAGRRAQPGPGHQVGGGGEPTHVQAHLGDDGAGQVGADAGDLR